MPTIDSQPAIGELTKPRLREGVLTLTELLPNGTEAVRVTLGGRVLRVEGSGAVQLPRLLGLLDGSRTVEELTEELDGSAQDEVRAAVDVLRRHALLEPPVDPEATETDLAMMERFAPEIRAFYDVGIHGAAVLKATQAGRAAVVGTGVLADAVTTALERIGVGFVAPVPASTAEDDVAWKEALADSHLAIVANGVEDPRFLAAFNAEALRLGRPWLMVRTSGVRMRLGPMFLPRSTACYVCYERRLSANATHFQDMRAIRDAVMNRRVEVPAPDNVMVGLAAVAADMAAFEALKFFGGWAAPLSLQSSLNGRFVDYAMLELEGTAHRVLKLPRCEACGVRAAGRPTTRAWMEPYDYR